jgi:hypothetical protein
MGETGPQIAILVFYVVPHLSSMVSSTIPAWDASVNDFGVVQDDRREPARIEGHRPGPLGILSDQDSLLATTARCQWRSATGSPSNRPHSAHGPSKSRAAASVASRLIRVRSCWRAGSGLPNKGHGGVFVGRAGLAAFSAAARAFEGRDVAEIGGSQATSESVIILSAAAGDGLQSTRSGLPRRKATRARDLLTC